MGHVSHGGHGRGCKLHWVVERALRSHSGLGPQWLCASKVEYGAIAARDYLGAQGIPGDGLLGGNASGADRHCDRWDFSVLHRVWSGTFVQVAWRPCK